MKSKLHPVLGEIFQAEQVRVSGLEPGQIRTIILLLSGCIALMMTGFGIIFPVFARRLGELGAGVEVLGWMIMAFALAQLLFAPLLGSLADHIGRKPIILLALVAFVLMNIGFLLAKNPTTLIFLRALEGSLTAGLYPSALGIVGDVAPEDQRGRWSGILMASYGMGFIFGPALGGFLYDRWGFAVPFLFSAIVALIALFAAIILIPETRPEEIRKREMLIQRRKTSLSHDLKESFWEAIPTPYYVFASLLLIDFVIYFTFAFVEPQMVFYFYDHLDWSTVSFGVVIGVYGASLVVGQAMLGTVSDRFARKPVIIVGLLLNSIFYLGLATVTTFPMMILIAAISGFGEALMMPALSAFYLDITVPQHRSRVLGIRESFAALGGVLGPLLVVWISRMTIPTVIFSISFVVMLLTTALALFTLKAPSKPVLEAPSLEWLTSDQRVLAAQAALLGLVLNAQAVRSSRSAR